MDDSVGTGWPPGHHDPHARSARDRDPRWIGHDPGGGTRPPLHMEAAATEYNASQLRRQLRDWLVLDVPTEAVDDLVLMAYEAMANAVEHAYAAPNDGAGPLRLDAHRALDGILITVSDAGAWRQPPGEPFRGRGLLLMRQLAHEVRMDSTPNGTVVHLRVDLPPPQQSIDEIRGPR